MYLCIRTAHIRSRYRWSFFLFSQLSNFIELLYLSKRGGTHLHLCVQTKNSAKNMKLFDIRVRVNCCVDLVDHSESVHKSRNSEGIQLWFLCFFLPRQCYALCNLNRQIKKSNLRETHFKAALLGCGAMFSDESPCLSLMFFRAGARTLSI